MTILTLSQIPTNINTVEKLHAWSGLLLASVNPTRQILETENTTEFVARYFVAIAFEGSTRLVERVSLPVDPTYVSDRTRKFWDFVQELSNTSIPASFLSN